MVSKNVKSFQALFESQASSKQLVNRLRLAGRDLFSFYIRSTSNLRNLMPGAAIAVLDDLPFNEKSFKSAAPKDWC